MEPRMRRSVGVIGIVFVILFLISSFMMPTTPDSHASVAKAVAFYHKHRGVVIASAWVIELAILVGVFFFWFLRDYLGRTDADRTFATIGFAGALLFAVSGGVSAGINFALGDSVTHVSGIATQTLNVLQNDLATFIAGPGVGIFLIATAIVCIRSAVLPRWLGWVGIVLAVLGLAVPFFAPPAAGLWVLIASIVIVVRERGTSGGAARGSAPAETMA